MASNFRIIHHRNSDRLHLKLTGDMDGNSAYEIINLLDDNSNGIKEVVIETSNLGTVFPFGLNVFCKEYNRIRDRYSNILFAGDKSNQIAPDENLSL